MYTVVGAEASKTLDLTLLEERIFGVPCHWAWDEVKQKERSHVCTDFSGECPHCKAKTREIWLGFLAAYDHTERQRVVFRMGPEGARQLKGFKQALGALRGVRLLVGLATAGKTGSLCLTKSESVPLIPLIPAHRIEPTICLVLKCRELPGYRYSPEEVTADNALTTDKGKPPDPRLA